MTTKASTFFFSSEIKGKSCQKNKSNEGRREDRRLHYPGPLSLTTKSLRTQQQDVNSFKVTLSSQPGRLWILQILSVCLYVCLSVYESVYPVFTAYILDTMSRILLKLLGNYGT